MTVITFLHALVWSESVSQALYLTGGSEAFEIAYFDGQIL